MAFFGGWSLARSSPESRVQSSVFVCFFLSMGLSLLINAKAFSSENDSLYAIKVYPDGTCYKVKWENIGKTPDDTNPHGGAPRFRAPRGGELERLTEEGDEVASKQPTPGSTAKISQVQVPVPPPSQWRPCLVG